MKKLNEAEFLEQFEHEKPIFEAWGSFLIDNISQGITGLGYDISQFLKIPASCRVKDNDSIVAKAFFRPEKQYDDPYEQITDKVGTRFVVLDLASLNVVKNIIEDNPEWSYSKDVDFQQNREDKPELFDYQSVHYIVRNQSSIRRGDVIIPAGTPCEVQVRTLLQHAYAEISHQTVYKSVFKIEPEVRRKLAKSMAMIEVADDLFSEVQQVMDASNNLYSSFISTAEEFREFPRKVDALNSEIFDAYKDEIVKTGITAESLKSFLGSNGYILERLNSRSEESVVYQQPVMLLIYYLAKEHTFIAQGYWPFDEAYITPIMHDLGIAS